ncbi:hypothetical protein OAQ71_00080 [bacterium]|nr:hypothetical protein [bacterium]
MFALGCQSTVEGRPEAVGGIDWSAAEFIPPDLLVATRWSEIGTFRVDALRIYEVERFKPAPIISDSSDRPVSFGKDEGLVASRPALDSPDVKGDFVEEGIEVRCTIGRVEELEYGWFDVSVAAAELLLAGSEALPAALQISIDGEGPAVPLGLERAAWVVCSESAAESQLERSLTAHRLLFVAHDRGDVAAVRALELALEDDRGRLVPPLDRFTLELLVQEERRRAPDGTVIDFRSPERVEPESGGAAGRGASVGELELMVTGEPDPASGAIWIKVTAANPGTEDMHQVIAQVSAPGLGFLLVPIGRVAAGQSITRFIEARLWEPRAFDSSLIRVETLMWGSLQAAGGGLTPPGSGAGLEERIEAALVKTELEFERAAVKADALLARWAQLADEQFALGSESIGSLEYRAWRQLGGERGRLCVELDEGQPLDPLISAVRDASRAAEDALRSAMRSCGRSDAFIDVLVELDALYLEHQFEQLRKEL